MRSWSFNTMDFHSWHKATLSLKKKVHRWNKTWHDLSVGWCLDCELQSNSPWLDNWSRSFCDVVYLLLTVQPSSLRRINEYRDAAKSTTTPILGLVQWVNNRARAKIASDNNTPRSLGFSLYCRIRARARLVTHSTKLEKNEETVTVHSKEELLGGFWQDAGKPMMVCCMHKARWRSR